ncbi:hypothetical protein T4B_15434 [Trichinella pseudospiralis]|uniref:Uncharacterized protein n=2 Tax=Trichinella pseudospiralis TaxID=6337 RepID=A0A0V1HB23_TRIPS|nr:hypothetical protein T4D_12141 [Trichinella pseudospiralis]KRZ07269.1 hypothetical protein T4B_15434 [Trichinella pseudospiralis]
MVADVLTKGIFKPKHEKCISEIDFAELLHCNGDHQFQADSRRLASSSRMLFPKPTPYSASAQQQSTCVAKLSNEETMSNSDILRIFMISFR